MKRVLFGLSIVLFASGIVFAKGTPEATQNTTGPQLTVQLMSDAAPDNDMVTSEINKILLPKVGATVKFQHLTWTDWQQNYRLLLASQAPIDILYAANWDDYASYARNGAYLQLDTLVPQTVPDLYKAIPKASWDGVKVDGKTYAVPALRYGFSGSFHMIYRQDLAKKFGVAPVTDIASMEKYFDAIRQNAPDMYPVEERGDGWMLTLFTYMIAQANPQAAWQAGILPQSELLYFDYRHPNADPKAPWEFPQYTDFLNKMVQYAQKGYWSKDILAEKSIAPELLEAGKSAAAIGGGENVDKVQELIQRVATHNPDWQIGDLSWDKLKGFAVPSSAQQDLSTVPIQSKNPKKALEVIQAFMLDKDLQFLLDYGIKGVHYTINDQNQYVQLPGSKGYPIFGMAGWAFKNQSLMLADGSVWGPQHDAYMKLYGSIAVPNNGFSFNNVPVQAQWTAVEQVEQQYGWPLWSGLVPNIQQGEAQFEQKLKAAGFDDVRAELKKQLAAYFSQMGQ